MPLPIPDIMERAAKVLELAKKVTTDNYDDCGGVPYSVVELREALKKVSAEDLMAVMNEVGKVYMGMHNIQILKIGSKAIPEAKTVSFALEIDFGLGPRTLLAPLPLDAATHLAKNFNDNVVLAATGTSVGSGLLLTAEQANGKP